MHRWEIVRFEGRIAQPRKSAALLQVTATSCNLRPSADGQSMEEHVKQSSRLAPVFFSLVALLACDELVKQESKPANSPQPASPTPSAVSSPIQNMPSQRFVFPIQTTPFPAASVALDTTTGRLCKTYPWHDSQNSPSGLALCSALGTTSDSTVTMNTPWIGATKAYRGYTYTFDGRHWEKGHKALRFDANGKTEPWTDDQYDPLGLFTKEEKAKRQLTEDQIRQVAEQFGVSYDEAVEDAKAQGYQVPPKNKQP
jgi:hypothetical protein